MDRELIIQRLQVLLSTEILSERWAEALDGAVALLKEQEAEKKCCRDCEYYGACHDE